MPPPPSSTSPDSLDLDSTSSGAHTSAGTTSTNNDVADLPPLYLKHVLTCPPSDAIPLRNMYASNVLAQRPRTPSPTQSPKSFSQRTRSPSIPGRQVPPMPPLLHLNTSRPEAEPTAIEAMQYIPCSSQSLPPSFITSFVRRVFTEDLCGVDFTQALTAMDYLKVLDDRKRRELAAALRRLDMDADLLSRGREELRGIANSKLAEWLAAIDDRGKKVEALYTQVYIGLRRWTLINEMRLAPFNKTNCIAMLNALYPPTYPALPTVQLTETILNNQRNAFFRYIQAVEKSGRGVLQSLELSGRRQGTLNGWSVVRDLVDLYLSRANELIEECMAIRGPEHFGGCPSRRADSGVSFGTAGARDSGSSRPSTSHRSSGASDKPLPPQPWAHLNDSTASISIPAPKKKKSRLENFARELRRIRSRSADRQDESDLRAAAAVQAKPSSTSLRGLRKMRSTSALNKANIPPSNHAKKDSGASSRNQSTERSGFAGFYEIDDAQRERLIREAHEARENKENRAPRRTQSPALRLETAFPPRRVGSPEENFSLPPNYRLETPVPPVPWETVPEPRLGQPAFPAELSA